MFYGQISKTLELFRNVLLYRLTTKYRVTLF